MKVYFQEANLLTFEEQINISEDTSKIIPNECI